MSSDLPAEAVETVASDSVSSGAAAKKKKARAAAKKKRALGGPVCLFDTMQVHKLHFDAAAANDDANDDSLCAKVNGAPAGAFCFAMRRCVPFAFPATSFGPRHHRAHNISLPRCPPYP